MTSNDNRETITQKLQSKLSKKLEQKFGVNLGDAAQTAKQSIDQALIALEHRGINIKDPQDFAQRVGRKVLERAESIREQIADKPFTPAWLKDVNLAPKAAKATEAAPLSSEENPEITIEASAAASLTETTVSEPAEEMQPKPMREFMNQNDESEAEVSDLTLSDEEIEEAKPAKKARKPKASAAKSKSSSTRARH